MELTILTAADVRRALPMGEAVEVMRTLFAALDGGGVEMPVRRALPLPEGTMLFMPAFVPPAALGQKVVGVFERNPARGLPTIHALVTLFDAATGRPRALLEGGALTALRTGAVSGLATDLLAVPDARSLLVFGAGAQAPAQIEAVCAVRPIEQVRIVSTGPSAARLAARLGADDPARRYEASPGNAAAVEEADVIVTATSSRRPLFAGAWVRVGTHVNAVGAYLPRMAEVDGTLVRRARVVVDERRAAEEEAGDLLQPVGRGDWSFDDLYAELGALAGGRVAPPTGAITLFKSVGLAAQDVAAGTAVLARATHLGLGQRVTL